MLSQRVSILEDGPPPRSVFDTDWLLVSGYVLLEQGPGFSASGPAPRRVVAGCSLAPAAADGWTRAARSLQPHLAVVNLDEARVLGTDAGAGEPPALSRHLGEVLGAVVVVTEPSGATAILDGEVVHTRSLATPSIDTTGAGDAFTAGLVAELLEDDRWPPTPDRLSVAMAAAGSLASAVAAVPGAQAPVAGEAGRA